MRIALVGTRGVPARYGGFETAAEEVGARLAARGHVVRVYCRNPGQTTCRYRGMHLVNLPAVRLKVLETLSHTALSVAHVCLHGADVAIVFNAANALFLPLLAARRVPVAVHVDGLEWKRGKWGPTGRRYYLASERLAARWADRLIVDAQAIGDYYQRRYGRSGSYLPYGAPITCADAQERLAQLALSPRTYHLVVARLEPENHVDVIVAAHRRSSALLPLVVVGGARYGERYVRRLNEIAAQDERIRLVGGIWDQQLLDELYVNAATYIHGHSVGGTNPSLLRAMGAATPVLALDVAFNREVLGDTGAYFQDAATLAALIEKAEVHPARAAARGRSGQDRARSLYDWDAVAAGYERLCLDLAQRPSRRTPP
ncbi:MAG: DUF1972 domain-containing protein [Egibacteraceae bacterium]